MKALYGPQGFYQLCIRFPFVISSKAAIQALIVLRNIIKINNRLIEFLKKHSLLGVGYFFDSRFGGNDEVFIVEKHLQRNKIELCFPVVLEHA
jgi:hypothetical protein